MNDVLDRPHVWVPAGPAEPDSGLGGPATALLMLHGTGGDERDLLPLRDHLSPGAAVLSVRGSVLENGMPRFFRRLSEGVFDEDDIRRRAAELAEFLAAAEERYEVPVGRWTAVGFSNGANIATALLMDHPAALSQAVLLAAMVPFAAGPPAIDLTGRRALIVNGAADPMATAWHTTTLLEQLRSRGADADLLAHPGGHTIAPRTLPAVAQWLRDAPSVDG